MSKGQSIALVNRFFNDVFSRGDRIAAEEILASDFAFYGPPEGIRGIAGFLQFTAAIRKALQVHFTVDVVIVDDEKAASLATIRGTHVEEFHGIPASGVRFALPRIDNFLILDGKIKEVRTTFDHHVLLHQLGAGTQ
ncbi:MAG: ester cyclase [Ktedonobacteraceae bacterium]|nr:ester cyclase [Ktedonobacteraceae bacterium]